MESASKKITIVRSESVQRALHLGALTMLSLAQPIFELIEKNPAFFTTRKTPALDVWILLFVLTLGPPAVLYVLATGFTRVGRRASAVATAAFVGILSAIYALLMLRWATQDGLPLVLTLLFPVVAGLLFGSFYYRRSGIRQFMTIVAVVCFIYPSIFVFSMRDILFPQVATSVERTPAVREPKDVIFVIYDEFPTISLMNSDGNIDARRFPNFARLAGTSTWYPKATTVWPYTNMSVTSILTGRYPVPGIEFVQMTKQRNLFTMLGADFNFDVSEGVTVLLPPWLDGGQELPPLSWRLRSLATDLAIIYLHRVLPEKLRGNLPDIDLQWGNFLRGPDDDLGSSGDGTDADAGDDPGEKAGDVQDDDFSSESLNVKAPADIAKGWASSEAPLTNMAVSVADLPFPSVNFVHAIFPHFPWRFLPDGRSYNATPRGPINQSRKVRLQFPEPAVDHIHQRHLLQIGYCDYLLGLMLDNLEEAGRLDDAMIVLVADHGIAFESNERTRIFSQRILARILFVPLIIKYPGQTEGEISALRATTADILPTIAEELGAGEGWEFDGFPLRNPAYPDTDLKSLYLSHLSALGSPRAVGTADLEFSIDKQYSRLMARLKIYTRAFRLDSPDADFYRIGPYAHLVGRVISGADRDFEGLDSKFTRDKAWDNVNLESNSIPLLIAGSVLSPAPEVDASSYVGLVVNGTIAGTSGLAEIDGKLQFSGMALPSAFHQGANDVRIVLLPPLP